MTESGFGEFLNVISSWNSWGYLKRLPGSKSSQTGGSVAQRLDTSTSGYLNIIGIGPGNETLKLNCIMQNRGRWHHYLYQITWQGKKCDAQPGGHLIVVDPVNGPTKDREGGVMPFCCFPTLCHPTMPSCHARVYTRESYNGTGKKEGRPLLWEASHLITILLPYQQRCNQGILSWHNGRVATATWYSSFSVLNPKLFHIHT